MFMTGHERRKKKLVSKYGAKLGDYLDRKMRKHLLFASSDRSNLIDRTADYQLEMREMMPKGFEYVYDEYEGALNDLLYLVFADFIVYGAEHSEEIKELK